MTLLYRYMAIFLNFPPTSSHLLSLHVENCDSNSRLVVYADDNVKSGLKGLINLFKIKIDDVIYLILPNLLKIICHTCVFFK